MNNIRVEIAIDVKAKDWYDLTKFAESHGWRFKRTSMCSTDKDVITGWFYNKFKTLKEFGKEVGLLNKFQTKDGTRDTIYISSFTFKSDLK